MERIFKYSILILSGILSGLGVSSYFFSFLIWVVFVGAFYFSIKDKKAKPVIYWSIIGFFHSLVSFSWIRHVSLLGMFCLVLYLTLWWVIYGLILSFFIKRKVSLIFIGPYIWIFLEYLRERVFWGLGWNILGYSQWRNIYLVQVVDLFGVKFISFLIMSVNIFLALLITKRLSLRLYAYITLLFLSIFGYNILRLNYLNHLKEEQLEVNIIQPNIAQDIKWDKSYIEYIKDILFNLSLESKKDALVIYPEASWPDTIDSKDILYMQNLWNNLGIEHFCLGALLREEDKIYNGVIYCSSENCSIYKKVKLVPFGEFVPFRKYLQFIPILNIIGDITAGESNVHFLYKDYTFSPLICFETVYADFVGTASKGAHFLVHLTNEAWFKGDRLQSFQSIGIDVMRAIENRISIVRCANTGVSGWVSYRGKFYSFILDGKELWVRGVYKPTICVVRLTTLYNHYKDTYIWIGLIICIFYLFLNKRRWYNE